MSQLNQDFKKPILFSLKEINSVLNVHQAKGFSVPIYQRLYSWSEKEILKLLEDFNNAFVTREDKDYFIGNLTLNFNTNYKRYDIIDGQQRLTTVWLIGLVLSAEHGEWISFLCNENDVLLKFAARDDDNEFLRLLIEKSNLDESDIISKEFVNIRMVNAIKVIRNYLRENISDKQEYSKFILNKVKSAAIFLPEGIDLNKYFEDMNNRGLQLEHHHILKATLLDKLENNLQVSYGKVWDAISQMNQYIEYGFEGNLKKNRYELLNHSDSYFQKADHLIESDNNKNEFFLKTIIERSLNKEYEKSSIKMDEEYQEKLTSICAFPEFLLHSLKLYTGVNDISMDEKKLLDTFSTHTQNIDVKKFIEKLLEYRIAFDNYFIKSIDTTDGVRWKIQRIIEDNNKQGDYIRMTHLKGSVVQLQSMLYVSTSTNLWLTKALRYILERNENECVEKDFIEELKAIDTYLRPKLPGYKDLNRGVSVTRYWFYKLDYLLWEKWTKNEDGCSIPNVEGMKELRSKIENFQFRDNRSVEHIHPRNPSIEKWVSENLDLIKDEFGNLALISVSSNSSLGNQDFESKQFDFKKRSEKWGIESLKLLSVYSNFKWGTEEMNHHQGEMIKVLCDCYNTDPIEYIKNYSDTLDLTIHI